MRFTRLLLVIVLAALPAAASADNAPAPSQPRVSVKAEQILEAAGRYLQSATQFTFHAQIVFDQVLPSGQKLQFAATAIASKPITSEHDLFMSIPLLVVIESHTA